MGHGVEYSMAAALFLSRVDGRLTATRCVSRQIKGPARSGGIPADTADKHRRTEKVGLSRLTI
jgi:hypothetical protein